MSKEIEEIAEDFTTCKESVIGVIRELGRCFYKLPIEYREEKRALFDETIQKLRSVRAKIESLVDNIHKMIFEEEVTPYWSKLYKPICPECGTPMKKIGKGLYQCPRHPFQFIRTPEVWGRV